MNEVSIKHPEWLYIDVMVKHHMGMTKSGSLMSGNACLVVGLHRHHKYWAIRYLGMAY